jgi:hypothetical protein
MTSSSSATVRYLHPVDWAPTGARRDGTSTSEDIWAPGCVGSARNVVDPRFSVYIATNIFTMILWEADVATKTR